MKTYRVYTDNAVFYTSVSGYNNEFFWGMVHNNGWLVEELTND